MGSPAAGSRAGILLGFVPLIVYGLLAGPSVQSRIVALGAATLVTVVAGFPDLKKGRILTWASLVLFGGLLVATVGLAQAGILIWSGVLINAVLAAVAFGSILAGVPFTLQYAREMVDPAHHDNPVFLRVNIQMTGVWGSVFTVNALLNYLALVLPGPAGQAAALLTYVFLATGIVFTLRYPVHIRKKYAHASPGG
ncbi:hypothetical protein [Methanoregula sp.]|uniref:hypothetical protein n=1 Tax=Methanoregula sp. TaxID=2052170 RepID=UPI002C25258A|nr:hypothetical protein [Methanoregula sp.]HVP97538.1 hypothetical protein [Methanoregula sp.]